MSHHIHIGDIVVVVGEPPDGDPRRAPSLIGVARKTALTAWKHGRNTTPYSFWIAPAFGPARRATPNDVNWATSAID